MTPRRLGLLVLLTALLAACSAPGAASSGASGRSSSHGPAASGAAVQLEVYAAASLRSAVTKATAVYSAAHPGTTFAVSTDSSAALETKIEQGAPADVFLSADTANAKKVVDKGLAAGAMTIFARNHLTIAVPAADPAGITGPVDLVRPGVKIVAAGDEVPITKYAHQLVANLAKQPGYPADYAARYEANVVSREDNVGAVLAKVALGEGDAGIVYVTDARSSAKVRVVDVPDAANVPATYGGVVLSSSPHAAAAAAFLAWLAGPGGQTVLGSFGFLPPG